MKGLLLAAMFFMPATSWAQYTPASVRLYLQVTGVVTCYQQVADTANQQLAILWPPGQLAEVVGKVGNVGHYWFALKPVTAEVTTVFYVKASTLHGKAELVDDPTREQRLKK
jgi:hypothetical protein